jgi:hypothetical protein
MNTDRLTIRVAGKEDSIPLASFLEIISNALTILEGLTRDISRNEKTPVEWRIVAMSMSSPGTVTVQGFTQDVASDVPVKAVNAYANGFRQIEESADEPPPWFTLPMLDAARRICNTLNDGVSAVTFAPEDEPPITPSLQSLAHVTRLIPKEHNEHGSLEGRLEVLSIHKKNYFAVYDRFTGRRVECTFREKDLAKAKEAFGRRVSVYGRIHYNREDMPTSMSVEDIEVLPEQNELPQLSDLEGMDITGGIDPATYLERLRGEDRR